MSNQIGDWLTDATISRTLTYDGFAFTLGNRYPTGNFFDDPRLCGGTEAGLGQAWSCNVPGFGSLIIGQQGIKTRATQILLSAQKPFTQEAAGAPPSPIPGPPPATTVTSTSTTRSTVA